MNDERDQAKYTISVAARLSGVGPQALRDYEKKGLLDPHRTGGNTRLYSDADLDTVRRIQELIARGINLAGIKLVVRLQDDLEDLQGRYHHLEAEMKTMRRRSRKRS